MHNHHTWIEISKHAIDHNIRQYKNIIGSSILAPVIKGNAYGHGIKEVASLCQQHTDVGWLSVATLKEALFLRAQGITKPIIVLYYVGEDKALAAEQHISLVAYDNKEIADLNSLGKKINKRFNIHIKIDTGLSRLGVLAKQAIDLIEKVRAYRYIYIEGIWTHFAEPEKEGRSFTNTQVALFQHIVSVAGKVPFIHCANTAGTSTVPHVGNFFRVGVGFYGYFPSLFVRLETEKQWPNLTLKPVLQLKTRVFSIKVIPNGSFVGYGRTYQAKQDAKIALLPTGYFDGFDRRFANKAYALVKNQYVPVVGNIGMNATTIDVTQVPSLQNGDIVTLIGDCEKIRADHLAHIAGMNMRELTTRLHPDIPRIIVP